MSPTSPSSASKSGHFPLWAIVLAGAAIAGISMGLRQIMGLYVKPVSEHLGIGREAFSIAIALANIVWGIAAPFVGAAADKHGGGKVVMFGAASTAVGLVLMFAATSDIHLFASGIFLGLGVAGSGVTALVGSVSRAAPPEKRTQVISMLGMGSGVGILIALPYAHVLIEMFGWQASLAVMTLTALLLWPLAFVIGTRPIEVASLSRPQSLGEALREAFGHPSFILLTIGFFVCGFHVAFYALHLPPYLADKGFDASVGVLALTMVGLGNLIGTWAAGQSAAFFPKQYTLSGIYLGRALCFLCFIYLDITPTLVVVLSFILGLLWLSTVPLTSSLVGTFFGPVWMTMLFGIVFFSHQVGSFVGVWLGGRLFDLTGSYDMMWWASVALGVFAALVHWPISQEPVERLRKAAATPAA